MKKVVVILLIALFCCGFVPQHIASRQSKNTKSVSELYAEAIKSLIIHRDTLKTVLKISEIYEQDTNHAPSLNLLARIHSNPLYAAKFAERAYLSDTTNFFYLETYGNALLRQNNYEKAMPVFTKIVRTTTNSDHFRILAILHNKNKDFNGAMSVLDSAIVRFGRLPWINNFRQHLFLETKQTLMAISDAQKVVEEEPYVAESHILLAKAHAACGQDSLALVSYQNAIATDSLNIDSWLALYEFHTERGNKSGELAALIPLFESEHIKLNAKVDTWKDLVKDTESYRKHYVLYDTLIKRLYILNPESEEVADLYILHLIASGEIDQALELSKKLIDKKSPTLEQFTRVIDMENYLNHTDSVRHYTALANKFFPNNYGLLMTQGLFAATEKKYEEAMEFFGKALQVTDDNEALSSAWEVIGNVEHERKDMKRCYQAYDKALSYNPENHGVLNNYAYFMCLENRELERALAMVNRALEHSVSATYLDTKAWILYKLGRLVEAKKVMQQALSQDRSNEATFALHYGDILYALGEEFMAKTYWLKALERDPSPEEIAEIKKRLGSLK